jgi:hypothetical protein
MTAKSFYVVISEGVAMVTARTARMARMARMATAVVA